jgi:hypothetical protein
LATEIQQCPIIIPAKVLQRAGNRSFRPECDHVGAHGVSAEFVWLAKLDGLPAE